MGATETTLQKRGANVTVLPLDSVVGGIAARNGLEVVYGDLSDCLKQLNGRRFDCVFMSNLLHLVPAPWAILDACISLLAPDGNLVIAGTQFNSLQILLRRAFGVSDY